METPGQLSAEINSIKLRRIKVGEPDFDPGQRVGRLT
jgi:hypothetical protein